MNKTKRELLIELEALLEKNGMYKIDGVNSSSSKNQLINAINCLKSQDEELEECLRILKAKYPNTYNTITNNGTDLEMFKHHSFNRLYVYNTARLLCKN